MYYIGRVILELTFSPFSRFLCSVLAAVVMITKRYILLYEHLLFRHPHTFTGISEFRFIPHPSDTVYTASTRTPPSLAPWTVAWKSSKNPEASELIIHSEGPRSGQDELGATFLISRDCHWKASKPVTGTSSPFALTWQSLLIIMGIPYCVVLPLCSPLNQSMYTQKLL